MKRKKKRLIDEFKKLDIYVQTFQFQYSEEMYVDLLWTTRGRRILVKDIQMVKDYPTLSSVSIPILEASIRFLNEKKKEKIS
jgi:hypothetical protein